MPGKSFRQGITLIEAVKQFGDEEAAEMMFIEARWPNGVACPTCGSLNVQERPTRKPQPFRCRDCRKDFSVKTDTVMQGSNIPLHKWALAVFLLNTSLKGVSSMKLHRDLGISQPSRLAPGPPHPQGMGDGRWAVRRPGRSGRDVHWRERAEQA